MSKQRKLRPLLARIRYSDEEWKLSRAGKCDVMVANYPSVAYCGRRSSRKSFYRWCKQHDQEVRDEDTYLAQWGIEPSYGREARNK